jgi:CheY-like chemotaxis protein
MTTALVIDDNRQTADSLSRMLSLFNVDSQTAYGARTALMYLKEATPEVIFLDLILPGVDGFEILAYIKRLPRMQGTPVIVITSDDQPETSEKALQSGAVAVIIKPITVDVLESALKKAGLPKVDL